MAKDEETRLRALCERRLKALKVERRISSSFQHLWYSG